METVCLKARGRQKGIPAHYSFTHRNPVNAAWFALVFLLVIGPVTAAETNEITELQAHCKKLIVGQSRLLEARPVVEKLLAITLRERPQAHPDTLVALHWAGYLAHQSGRYADAVQTWEKSLAIQEKQPTKDPIWFPRTLNMLAGVYEGQFDFARAEAALKRALELREKNPGPNHPDTAQVIRSIGRLRHRSGDYAQAEACFLRVLRIYENEQRINGDQESGIAEALAALGYVYREIGDLKKSEPLLVRAFELNRQTFGLRHARTLNSLSSLAGNHYRQGDLREAEAGYLQCLRIREELYGTNDLSLSWLLQRLASVYRDTDRRDEAESTLQRAFDIARQNLGPEHPHLATTLMAMGEVNEERGDGLQARGRYEHALELLERHLEPMHQRTVSPRRAIARMNYLLGQSTLALLDADLIQDAEELKLANLFSFTSERQRLVYVTEWASGSRYDLWATMGAVHPLARAILRTKSLVLDSVIEDRLLAEASGDPQLLKSRDQLTRKKRQLAQFQIGELSLDENSLETASAPKAVVEALAQQVESLEADLARNIIGLDRTRRGLSATLGQVQAALPERAALVEFLRYEHCLSVGKDEDRYGALVVVNHADPVWVSLGEAAAVEKQLKLYQHLVRSESADDSLAPLLRNLHEQLWAPLEQSLPSGTQRIILCPDAQLNFLSFATLLNSSNRFVGEDYSVSYVSSGRDLLTERSRAPDYPQLVVWSNPDFDNSNIQSPDAIHAASATSAGAKRDYAGLVFRPLPGSEKEGRSLRNRAAEMGFARTTLHQGADATEAALSRVDSPGVLHMATHGFVLPDNAAGSMGARTSSINPMLRSGLALAGARRTLESWTKAEPVVSANDGIVTAEEIGCLNLRNTWLVTLSACDTGMGEGRAGEGVLGLRRGFIHAGAQNLLLTLWTVDDARTAEFMPEFYRAALATGDPPGALADVQGRWLTRLRTKTGIAEACRLAGPFILSFQGKPAAASENASQTAAR